MSKFALLSGVSGVGAAGVVATGMAMGMIEMPSWMRGAETVPATAVLDTQDTAPQVAAAPADPEAEPLAEADAAAPSAAPAFDLVRAEPDGSTQVAGSAAPGSQLEVMVNGAMATQTTVGGDGKFFVLFDLPDPTIGSVISLVAVDGNRRTPSQDDVIVAPIAPQVALAETAPKETEVAALDAPLDETATRTAPLPQPTTTVDAVETPALTAPDSSLPDVAAADAQAPQTTDKPAAPVTASDPAAVGIDPATQATAALPEADTGGPAALAAPETGGPTALARASDPALSAPRSAPSAPATTARAEAPAVLLATPRGVEVLQNAPLAPGEVALDAISYDAAGDVLLSGRGDEAAFLRIYLDNTPVTTSRIREDGRWKVELPEVDAGTYTLRVDQLDAGGAVVARVESPFLRESPAALEAATQGEGAIRSITVQPGNTLWAISQERYGDGVAYVKVFRANRDRIRNPDLIYPGQIFDLPE